MHRILLPEVVFLLCLTAKVVMKVDLNHQVYIRFYEQRYPHFKNISQTKKNSSFQLKWECQDTKEHQNNNQPKENFFQKKSCLSWNV